MRRSVNDRGLQHDRARPAVDLGQRRRPGNHELLVIVSRHLNRPVTLDRDPDQETIATGADRDGNHFDVGVQRRPRASSARSGNHILGAHVSAIVGIVIANWPVAIERGCQCR